MCLLTHNWKCVIYCWQPIVFDLDQWEQFARGEHKVSVAGVSFVQSIGYKKCIPIGSSAVLARTCMVKPLDRRRL